MSKAIETPHVCVVCKSDSKNLLTDPDVDKGYDILHYAKRLADLGEVAFRPLSDFLSSLSKSELEEVRYHSDCRKKVINKLLLERAERKRAHLDSPSAAQPAKRGRPAKSSSTGRLQRHTGVIPKEIVCIFAPPTGKCKYHEEELHKVSSLNRGQTTLLTIILGHHCPVYINLVMPLPRKSVTTVTVFRCT